jgi:hypothetical protein
MPEPMPATPVGRQRQPTTDVTERARFARRDVARRRGPSDWPFAGGWERLRMAVVVVVVVMAREGGVLDDASHAGRPFWRPLRSASTVATESIHPPPNPSRAPSGGTSCYHGRSPSVLSGLGGRRTRVAERDSCQQRRGASWRSTCIARLRGRAGVSQTAVADDGRMKWVDGGMQHGWRRAVRCRRATSP